MTAPSIVFVHGSYFSEWCWIPVIDRLERAGISCHTVELPFTSVSDDVAALRAAIEVHRASGPVVVVCHSYSGITTSLAGHDADHLVFVAARLPDVEESPRSLTSSWGYPEFQACIVDNADGSTSLTADAERFLFQGSPTALATISMAHRRPMRSVVPSEPIDRPAWREVPSSYVVCTEDLAVRVEQQRDRARRVQHSIEIDCDHSPFFSAPDELAAFLTSTVQSMADSTLGGSLPRLPQPSRAAAGGGAS